MKFHHVEELNTRIRETCHRRGLKLRSGGNGLWLCSLLPGALCCCVSNFNEYTELYKVTLILSIGLFISSVCNVLNNVITQIPLVPIGMLLSSTIVSLLLVFCTQQNVAFVLSFAMLSSIAFPLVLMSAIKNCPRCFTYGEAMLTAQALILFLSSFCTNVILLWDRPATDKCDKIAPFFLQVGCFTVLMLVLTAFHFPNIMKNFWMFTSALVSFTGVFIFGLPLYVVKKNSILWLLQLMNNWKAVALLGLWTVSCWAAAYCLFYQCRKSVTATTSMRKCFHFLIFIVIVPGLILRPCLVYIASGVALALLVVLETARKLKLTAHSNALQACFEVFKDEKDEGDLALTPLYLMVGCVAPMWIYPFSSSKFIHLPVLSGLLTVAVGDAMASIGGMWFGRNRWPNSSKTLEGTCCCFLSQVLVLWLLNYFGYVRLNYLTRLLFALGAVSIFEAKTDQVDNLVLPFVSYILFCWSC